MNKTTSKSSLDGVKLKYEEMPLKPKPKAIQMSKLKPPTVKKPRRKHFNPVKEYFKAILEVILK